MPFDGAQTWFGKVNEDGSFSILARLVDLNGTGDQVSDEEGPCIKQADVDNISAKVYNLGANKDATTGTEITPAPTISITDNILDTLRTVGWPTQMDYAGYNFRHDLGPTFAPNANEWYLIEYRIALLNGGILWLRAKVKSVGVQTS